MPPASAAPAASPAGSERGRLRHAASRHGHLATLGVPAAVGERAPQLLRERRRGRPLRRVDRDRAGDRREQALRQVGPLLLERRRARLDRRRHLRQRHAPERVLARERLPEQDPDAPDVARRAGLLAAQPLGRDVRERSRARRRPRSASPSRRTARARSRAAAPRRSSPSASSTFDGLTSRWMIPRPCAWARPSRICAAASTASRVAQLARRASPRAASGRRRTRTRCRRGRSPSRSRTSGGSARGAGGTPPRPRARRERPPCPRAATIFSATSRPVCSSRASQTEPEPPLPSGRSGR